MDFKTWMIAIALAFVCGFGMLSVATDMKKTYGGGDLDSEYSETFDQMDYISEIQENMTDSIISIDPEANAVALVWDLFSAAGRAVIGTVKMIFGSIPILFNVITGAGETMSIPVIFLNVMIFIVMVTLFTLFIRFMMRQRE